MIDTALVQHLIETGVGPDYEIGTWHDTEPYIIIFWKHKVYSEDDERGQLVGCGPVVYFKTEQEYRLLGSGEWFYGDYADYLDPELFTESNRKHDILMGLLDGNKEEAHVVEELINDRKVAILKRDYINTDDIDSLCILFEGRRLFDPFDMVTNPDYESINHVMVVFNNEEGHKKLIAFWQEIGFGYVIVSDTELVLFKTREGS